MRGGDFLQHFSVMLVVGNMCVVVAACLLGIVICFGFLDFLSWWWRWPKVWG